MYFENKRLNVSKLFNIYIILWLSILKLNAEHFGHTQIVIIVGMILGSA